MFDVKESEDKATIYVYGAIGDHWKEEKANRAKDFAKILDDLSPKAIDIRIDSPGGDVFEGFAIASAIQRYEGGTHAFVDGMAASAASYIAIMADKVTMNDFAAFMIHNASGIAIGNRDTMRETADLLERIDNSIAGTIAARTGMDVGDVKAAMSAETWYFGDDAEKAGLCDEVIKTEKRGKAKLSREFADEYKNVPDGVEVVDDAEQAAETIHEPKQRYMITLNDNGLTFFPVDDGEPAPDGNAPMGEGEPSPADEATEPTPEPSPQDLGNGTSHGETNLAQNEARDAKGAILLGNRIYRKEN